MTAIYQSGDALKQAAHASLEAHREQNVRCARRAFLRHALDHGTATADDVRAVIDLPDGIDPKLFGAVPGALARAGIVRHVGFTKTRRPKAHARPVSVWGLVNRAKAEAWLSENPPPDSGLGRQLPLPIMAPPTESPAAATVGREG